MSRKGVTFSAKGTRRNVGSTERDLFWEKANNFGIDTFAPGGYVDQSMMYAGVLAAAQAQSQNVRANITANTADMKAFTNRTVPAPGTATTTFLKVVEAAPNKVLNSLDDVAAQMRTNLPPGMNPKQFGEVLKWGGGSQSARQRISTLTADELRQAGITAEMADNWAAAYDAVARLTPNNPSAAGRADLMRHAARLLRGE